MTKKIAVLVLILIIMCNFSLAEGEITYFGLSNGTARVSSIDFSDVKSQGDNYWAKPAIYEITALGVMNGLPGVVFSPTTKVTNEQAITTVLNALGKTDEVNAQKGLSNTWSDKYIKYGMANGLITEKIVMAKVDAGSNLEAMKKKGVYIRDNVITREEIASLIVRAFNVTVPTDAVEKEFFDKSQIDTTKASAVDAISKAGIMVGNDDGMFNPKSGLTRAEFAQIFKNCEKYLLDNVGVVKKTGFVDGASATGINITDGEGNSIEVKISGLDFPVLRRGVLTNKSALCSGDEIEFFINTSREVKFVKVIDEGISGNTGISEGEKLSKQGIVTGNSPYFYQISIKDKNGMVESYSYGRWTDVYKDGKETNATDILQGDTVYLEFDEVGDLVVIRGVTNSVINYGTITKIDDTSLTINLESGISKKYSVGKIPVYKGGVEVAVKNLQNGEYAKIYSTASELIKIEIVEDERTLENLYKGVISDINLIQDRIIIKNPEKMENGKWVSAEESFITIPLDKTMKVIFDGTSIEKKELGEKQLGKFAYIATRQDTQEVEKVKSISISREYKEKNASGKVRTYSENEYIKLTDSSTKFYIDDSTIFVVDGKIVVKPVLGGDARVVITAVSEDGDYIAKVVETTVVEEEKGVDVYCGTIKYIDGEELTISSKGRFEDGEWVETKTKQIVFTITSETRIYGTAGPISIKEFNETDYKSKPVNVIAYGDEIVVLNTMDMGATPYVIRASVSEVSASGFTTGDVEYFDLEDEEWYETSDRTVNVTADTIITKNGNYAKQKDIEENQEAIVISASDTATGAGIVLLTY